MSLVGHSSGLAYLEAASALDMSFVASRPSEEGLMRQGVAMSLDLDSEYFRKDWMEEHCLVCLREMAKQMVAY